MAAGTYRRWSRTRLNCWPWGGCGGAPGTVSDKPYSVFMDVYAALCRHHMKTYGTTQRQIAAVAAKNHQHSVHNPLSQFRQPFTIEEVLAAAPITYPLTIAMCSPISDGAAAVVLCNAAGLKRLTGAGGRAVRLLASVIQTGSNRGLDEPHRIVAHLGAGRPMSRRVWRRKTSTWLKCTTPRPWARSSMRNRSCWFRSGKAGRRPSAATSRSAGASPSTPRVAWSPRAIRSARFGLGQIHELVTQLRGEAGARQVDGARIAIQENGGGLYGIEEAVVAVNILARP